MNEEKQKELIETSKEVLKTSEILWNLMKEKDDLILVLKEENFKLMNENVLLNFKYNEIYREIILLKETYGATWF